MNHVWLFLVSGTGSICVLAVFTLAFEVFDQAPLQKRLFKLHISIIRSLNASASAARKKHKLYGSLYKTHLNSMLRKILHCAIKLPKLQFIES